MKYSKKEAGNIIYNTLIVVALFAIAYFWYAKQPEPSLTEMNEDEQIEGVVTEENQNSPEGNEVFSNINNLVTKSVGTSEKETTEQEPVPSPLNSIMLAETDSGNFATITYANLTQPGYIAIYKVNSSSETVPIGHTDLLPASIISNLKIELGTVTAEKQTIVAVLHQDDGDGLFEFPESDSYLKNGGFIVSDVDVVEIPAEREAKNLKDQVDRYLENNFSN